MSEYENLIYDIDEIRKAWYEAILKGNYLAARLDKKIEQLNRLDSIVELCRTGK